MRLLEADFALSLQQLAGQAPQAILLEGVCGHSAEHEATALAEYILKAKKGGSVQTLRKSDDKTVIGIDQIQTLYQKTRAKQLSGCNVWIIEEAGLLSEAAQNAFLKLLEEPPAAVIFILASERAASLLRTIQSRCHIVRCAPFSSEDAASWLKERGVLDQALAQQLLFLSEYSPSELVRLVEDEVYCRSQLSAAAEAKQLISGKIFDQIALISTLSGNREKALTITKLALRMLTTLAPRHAHQPEFAARLQTYSRCYEQLSQNGNIKIQQLRAILG